MPAIIELIRGLWITLTHLFTKHVTIQYPKERRLVPERFRGPIKFLLSEADIEEKCVACSLCTAYCPSSCIKIASFEDEKHNKRLSMYEIDLSRCIFCGFCTDACLKEAIKTSEVYELACYKKEDMVYSKETLIKGPIVQKYK
ncbi:TPA: NADH-quinone oxidoreductase subunit I [bacterium]|nr:NADH-quinone oxidoreductase subunit I [bacterium]